MSKAFNAQLLPKCADRLAKAKRALLGCRRSRSFGEFASHWAEFLIHTGGVLNALDAGSKETPQGRQWYGKIKREGRTDPLVSYMHQARNVEEHGPEPTTRNAPTSVEIGAAGEPIIISNMRFGPELLRDPIGYLSGRVINAQTGALPTIKHTPGGPELLTVADPRFGNAFDPPKEHKGRPIKKTDPIRIAEVYVTYLAELINEAERHA